MKKEICTVFIPFLTVCALNLVTVGFFAWPKWQIWRRCLYSPSPGFNISEEIVVRGTSVYSKKSIVCIISLQNIFEIKDNLLFVYDPAGSKLHDFGSSNIRHKLTWGNVATSVTLPM